MYIAKVNGKDFTIELKQQELLLNGEKAELDWVKLEETRFHAICNKRSYNVEILNREGKNLLLKINGKKYEVLLQDSYDQLLARLGLDKTAAGKVNEIKAPMPGLVLKVFVEPGATVKKGDALLVLEAMKMENILKSPGDGVVGKVNIAVRDKVEKNQVLLSMN